MKTVLISGANGFLGRHLVAACLERGMSVRGIGTTPASTTSGIIYHRLDLTKPVTDHSVFESVDIAIHAAAILPTHGRDPSMNSMITRNFVDGFSSAPPENFVHFSSASVYGSRPGERREDDDLSPQSAYGLSKLKSERIVKKAATQGNLRHACILRPANVFGPGMAASNNLLRLGNAISRRRFVGLGTGDNRKSLLYIDDAVDACLLASELQNELQIFNVSTGHLNMRHIAKTIAQARDSVEPLWLTRVNPTAISSGLQKLPLGRLVAAGQSIGTFASTDMLDDQRIRGLGFEPATDLTHRLADTFGTERAVR